MVNSKKFSPISIFKRRIPSIFLFSFLIFNLLSCDLFNSSDKDYLSNIDEEIAWANAERLTVQVAVPSGWGTSPQTARCYDAVRTNETPRKGYPFTVEFSPNSGYGFVEWLAFGSEYTLSAIADMTLETARTKSLNNKNVSISAPAATVTGAIGSSVTVNVNVPITLVPFCDIRPRLDLRTYPPVNPMQSAFPYDQPINLWFTLPIRQDSAAGNVRISAVHTSDENLLGKKRGELFGTSGDLSNYYKMDFPGDNRIDLIPKNSAEYPSNHLMLLAITVEVGPGIQSTAGHTMDAVEKITFQTDTNEAPKVYKPGVISASRALAGVYFTDSTEFRNPDIDRRFNRIMTAPNNYNTVYIKFSVTPPDDAPSPNPNRITVIERMAYDMRGMSAGGSSETTEYTSTASEVNYNMGAGEYTITHRLKTIQSGIIQLVVLPWYNDTISPVAPLATDKAVAMSQYVTVVMDLSAPMKNASRYDIAALNVSLDFPSSTDTTSDPLRTIYVYGSSFSTITVTVGGLAGLTDNGTDGGISAALAWSAPWTMDDPGKLYWYAQIGEDSIGAKALSPKLDVYSSGVLNYTWSPASITSFTDPYGYRVLLKFEDRMGNVSAWMDTGLKVKYSDAATDPVTALEAECNAAGSQITVKWNTPPGMKGAYVSVNGSETRVDGTGIRSHTFSTPAFYDGSVRSGQAVGNVTKYDIKVTAYNDAGRADPEEDTEVTIWNIPDMNVAWNNKAIEVTSVSNAYDAMYRTIGLTNIALGDSSKQYVLTKNLTAIPLWVPVGDGSGTNVFKGKFYGNGNTITLNGGLGGTQYRGLFGYVQDATIRDLRVEYANPTTVSTAGALHFGGIAGNADGNTYIRNVIVGGNGAVVSLTNNATISTQTYAGMITGSMQPTVLIENCFTKLELEVTASGQSGIRAGGISGIISDVPTVLANKVMIDNVTMAGKITAKSTNQTSTVNFVRMGGIVGECQGRGIIQNSDVTGTLEMAAKSSTSSQTTLDYICGGIIGRMKDGQMRSCHFTGRINIDPTSHVVEDQTIVGGLVGALGAVFNNSGSVTDFNSTQVSVWDSSASGNIIVTMACNSKVLLGGVFGTLYGLNASNNIDFRRCEYTNGQIRFSRIAGSGQSHIGGFGAEAVANIGLYGCQSRADLIKVDFSGTAGDGAGTIGGFIGIFRGDATGCYSTSPIEANIGGNVTAGKRIGGFVGEFNTMNPAGGNSGPWTINRCYAGGNVKVTVTSTQAGLMPKVGGFIGSMRVESSAGTLRAEDCYATGEVSFDRKTGTSPNAYSFIAGFISELAGGANVTVNRCFSTGSVTNNSNTGSGSLCVAGGLIGETRDNPTVSNSVALGSSVILSGPSTVTGRIGSVIGFINGTANLTVGNYARSGLRLYQSTTYNDTPVTYLLVTPNVNGKEGADTTTNNTSGFWTGLGYTSSVWDFSGVSRGYPTLY